MKVFSGIFRLVRKRNINKKKHFRPIFFSCLFFAASLTRHPTLLHRRSRLFFQPENIEKNIINISYLYIYICTYTCEHIYLCIMHIINYLFYIFKGDSIWSRFKRDWFGFRFKVDWIQIESGLKRIKSGLN